MKSAKAIEQGTAPFRLNRLFVKVLLSITLITVLLGSIIAIHDAELNRQQVLAAQNTPHHGRSAAWFGPGNWMADAHTLAGMVRYLLEPDYSTFSRTNTAA